MSFLAPTATDPLTTVFTPSTWCTQPPYTYSADLDGNVAVVFKQFNTSCYPTNFAEHTSLNGIYSPGVCPLDYTAISTIHSGGDNAPYTSICCPKSLTSFNSKSECYATETTAISLSKVPGSSEVLGDVLQTAPAVLVAWASGDLKSFKPASAPLLSGTALYQAPHDAQQLSAGELAATIVLSIVGGLIGIGILLWVLLLKNRGKRPTGHVAVQSAATAYGRENETYQLDDTEKRHIELHGLNVNEVSGDSMKKELHGLDLKEMEDTSPRQESGTNDDNEVGTPTFSAIVRSLKSSR